MSAHLLGILALCSRRKYIFVLLPLGSCQGPLGENSFPTTTISISCTLRTRRGILFQPQIFFLRDSFVWCWTLPSWFHPHLLQSVVLHLYSHSCWSQLAADLPVGAEPAEASFPSALPSAERLWLAPTHRCPKSRRGAR